MSKGTVIYDKEKIIQVLRDLEVLVVSTDRIGSVWADGVSDDEYKTIFLKFFDDFGFFRKLASARRVLAEAFSDAVGEDGMDELERRFQDLEFWSPPPQV
ncbi:MAG TPA: hypothetical protein VFZ49_05050 [Pyrinomonadaceae bacterium]